MWTSFIMFGKNPFCLIFDRQKRKRSILLSSVKVGFKNELTRLMESPSLSLRNNDVRGTSIAADKLRRVLRWFNGTSFIFSKFSAKFFLFLPLFLLLEATRTGKMPSSCLLSTKPTQFCVKLDTTRRFRWWLPVSVCSNFYTAVTRAGGLLRAEFASGSVPCCTFLQNQTSLIQFCSHSEHSESFLKSNEICCFLCNMYLKANYAV